MRRRARTPAGAGGTRPRYGIRLAVFIGVVLLLMTTLLGRLAQVQLLQHDDYAAASRTVNTRQVTTEALRGRILAANGRPLVDNRATTVVTVDRSVLLDAPDGGRGLVHRLARRLGLPYEQLWGRTRLCGTEGAPAPPVCWNGSPYRPVPVATHLPPRVALSLLERPEELPGVAVEADPVREYPHPDHVNAAHLVGYLGRPTAEEAEQDPHLSETALVGRAGLEAAYDDVLRGTPGSTTVAIDPRGVVLRRVDHTDPVRGNDLLTHISPPIQRAAERALDRAVRGAHRRGEEQADSGAAVVLDVRTGAVVALASHPTYRPEVWTGGISELDLSRLTDPEAGTPLVDRAIAGVYPPASTFKVISLPAAVKDGVRLHGTYRCTSGVQVGDRVFHNYESEAYGPIGLAEALEVSCDTVFYRFAYRAWKQAGGLDAPLSTTGPFVDMARAFGLGSSTGVDLPGESAGRIADRQWKHDRWVESRDETCRHARDGYPEVEDRQRARYLRALARDNCRHGGEYRPGDAVNFAIGQGDTAVTPLQMAVVYAAIANGGTLWTPHVGAAVRTPAGRTVRTIEPERAGRVELAPDLLRLMHRGLAAVVRTGTAAGAFSGFPLEDYPLAGKTGTAEVFGQDATSWFASYGPTTDPRYAVVVVVPRGGTGASTAAPAVRQIWEAIRRQG